MSVYARDEHLPRLIAASTITDALETLEHTSPQFRLDRLATSARRSEFILLSDGADVREYEDGTILIDGNESGLQAITVLRTPTTLGAAIEDASRGTRSLPVRRVPDPDLEFAWAPALGGEQPDELSRPPQWLADQISTSELDHPFMLMLDLSRSSRQLTLWSYPRRGATFLAEIDMQARLVQATQRTSSLAGSFTWRPDPDSPHGGTLHGHFSALVDIDHQGATMAHAILAILELLSPQEFNVTTEDLGDLQLIEATFGADAAQSSQEEAEGLSIASGHFELSFASEAISSALLNTALAHNPLSFLNLNDLIKVPHINAPHSTTFHTLPGRPRRQRLPELAPPPLGPRPLPPGPGLGLPRRGPHPAPPGMRSRRTHSLPGARTPPGDARRRASPRRPGRRRHPRTRGPHPLPHHPGEALLRPPLDLLQPGPPRRLRYGGHRDPPPPHRPTPLSLELTPGSPELQINDQIVAPEDLHDLLDDLRQQHQPAALAFVVTAPDDLTTQELADAYTLLLTWHQGHYHTPLLFTLE